MEQGLWKLLAFILVVALLFVYPTLQMFERQDQITQMLVLEQTDIFVQLMREQGYLTPQNYMDFLKQLEATGHYFQVHLEHQQKRYVPVYTDPIDPATFAGQVKVAYYPFTDKEIKDVLFPQNQGLKIDDHKRRYLFSKGDMVLVTVQSKHKSKAMAMRDMLSMSHSDFPAFFTRLGGMVTHEID